MQLPHSIARLMIGGWLRASSRSWKRRPIAADSPHLHAPGVNPDRVLLVGDGVATGRGVLTHQLGLPGHIARSLSALTGHATDVDICVHQDMTVETVRAAIFDLDLTRYDTIVLSIGHNEALSLMRLDRWRGAVHDLLAHLGSMTSSMTPISILTIPEFDPETALPAGLARIVDQHVRAMNAATAELISGMAVVTLIAGSTGGFEPETRQLYKRWADSIAADISATLNPDRPRVGNTAVVDEQGRQAALELMETNRGSTDALDDLVASARNLFGTPLAAVTLIHSDHQTLRAVSGYDQVVLPRDEVFCDVTIRRASHLVIEDASSDPRYAHFAIVADDPNVRFYAGYPIESPDGYRVGAFCVMDTKVRTFTEQDLGMLRSMAHLAQERLWPRA